MIVLHEQRCWTALTIDEAEKEEEGNRNRPRDILDERHLKREQQRRAQHDGRD